MAEYTTRYIVAENLNKETAEKLVEKLETEFSERPQGNFETEEIGGVWVVTLYFTLLGVKSLRKIKAFSDGILANRLTT